MPSMAHPFSPTVELHDFREAIARRCPASVRCAREAKILFRAKARRHFLLSSAAASSIVPLLREGARLSAALPGNPTQTLTKVYVRNAGGLRGRLDVWILARSRQSSRWQILA